MNEEYKFLERVFLRAPYYSFEEYRPAKLPGLLADPAFRDAIWLASADLYRALEKKGFVYVELSERERYALLKYYNRMSFRPTPFGAFASFSTLTWSEGKRTRLGPATLHLLPSGTWLGAYRASLKTRERDKLLRVNPLHYQLGTEIRYARYARDPSGKLQFALAALPAGALNHALLKKAAIPVFESILTAAVKEMTGCTGAEASAYTAFLLDEQVLHDESEGALLSREGLSRESLLINKITGKELSVFWNSVADIPSGTHGNMPDQGRRLAELNEAQGISVSGNAFYAALERTATGGPDLSLQDELAGTVAFLRRLLKVHPPENLVRFTGEFTDKFDRQQVPLLLALDPDSGITYGGSGIEPVHSPLLKDLAFPLRDLAERGIDWTAAHRLIFRKWFGERTRGTFDPVILSEADMPGFPEADSPPLPPTMPVMFRNTTEGIEIESIGSVSGTVLTGRFSVFSGEAYALAKETAAFETAANPDVLFAELHQLSHDHVDNINRRLPLYEGLIEINGFAGETGMVSVALNDLVLSVRQGELILESISLGRRVIPRLPTAYNFRHNNLGVFRLLCDLQFQGLQVNLTLDIQKLLPGLEFYPRLQYKQVIVSPARWLLNGADLADLGAGERSLGKLHLFREKRGIPRWVAAGEGDRQLVFDLGDDQEARFFLDFLKEHQKLMLREYLPPAKVITGEKKKAFAGQYVAMIVNTCPVYPGTSNAHTPQQAKDRKFLPGGEWLYLKVYCTAQSADRVLVTLHSILRKFPEQDLCWFFIRFRDPQPHLRIRIRCSTDTATALLRAFNDAFSNNPLSPVIREVSSDTYEREIERYTPELIPAVEAFFHAGSENVLELLQIPGAFPGNGKTAIRIIYRMAETFLCISQELLSFFQQRRDYFLREFRADKAFRIGLNDKYRALSPALWLDLSASPSHEDGHENTLGSENLFFEILDHLAAETIHWNTDVRAIFLADLIHMQLNRMFSEQQREHELVIYFFLHKYQESRIARSVEFHT